MKERKDNCWHDDIFEIRDQLKDRLKDVEEESERRRLSIENLLLQALTRGKQIEELEKKLGELFKERDELYDKYVHKACDGYRC